MSNELSQLDQLIESDVLDALGKPPRETSSEDFESVEIEQTPVEEEKDDTEEVLIEDFLEEGPKEEEEVTQPNNPQEEVIGDISSAGLTKLLSELLNNKTIEITIKIKD